MPGSAGQCGEEVQIADAAGIMQAGRCVPRTAPPAAHREVGRARGTASRAGNAEGMWADDVAKLGRIGQRAKEGRRKKKKEKRKWRAKEQWANRGRAGDLEMRSTARAGGRRVGAGPHAVWGDSAALDREGW